jgi:acyl-CoA reductase-like NAD-dependent aldehyde dehydrogenase
MIKGRQNNTKTFDELDYTEQAKSISGQISILEKAIRANIRRAKKEQKKSPAQNRIEQVERLVQRLKKTYDE